MTERPTDPYDAAWPAYWAANPLEGRSVGAMAAEADAGGDDDAAAAEAAAAEAKATEEAEAAKAAEAAKTAEAAADTDWRAPIEDEGLRKFAERFTDPGDAVKAAFDLRQQISKGFEAPGEDATDDEKAEHRARLGVPETVDAYEIDLPEETPKEIEPTREDLEPFLSAMHEAGAPAATVQAAIDWFYGTYLPEGQKFQEEESAKALKEASDALDKEWPDPKEQETNLNFAQRAAAHFGSETFTKFLVGHQIDGVPLDKHPEFVRVFAKIGRRISEKGVQIGMTDDEVKDSETKMDELTAAAWKAQEEGNVKERDRLFAEREALSASLHGGEAVVGSESRTL